MHVLVLLHEFVSYPRLMEPKVHYRFHKSPPHVSTLNHKNTVHAPSSYFLKIHLIYPPIYVYSSKWSLSPKFYHWNPVRPFPLAYIYHTPRSSHSWIMFGKNRSRSSSLCGLLNSLPLRHKYLPHHPTLKHPQTMFFPQCERSSFIPIQNNRKY
jgi:hypothetical protein